MSAGDVAMFLMEAALEWAEAKDQYVAVVAFERNAGDGSFVMKIGPDGADQFQVAVVRSKPR